MHNKSNHHLQNPKVTDELTSEQITALNIFLNELCDKAKRTQFIDYLKNLSITCELSEQNIEDLEQAIIFISQQKNITNLQQQLSSNELTNNISVFQVELGHILTTINYHTNTLPECITVLTGSKLINSEQIWQDFNGFSQDLKKVLLAADQVQATFIHAEDLEEINHE